MCPSREAHIATDTSRETVTVIEAASAGGDTISPMVIIGASQHSESWVNNDLSSETLIAVSESGYSDDLLAWKWIKHFADKTKRMRRGSKQLLIFDGHGSHCTKQFIDVCTKNDIIPFTLPPHASHFLQPLDVAVFQPYKHWHRDAVDKATRTGCTNFSKVEFLAALNSTRAQTMKPRTIKTGFRCAGIFPFNPAVALQQFDQLVNAISESPSSSAGHSPAPSSAPATPKSVRTLTRTADLIGERSEELSPSLARTVNSFVRGALVQVQTGNLAIEALKVQTAAQQARDKRNERSRKSTQSGGVLYVEEARSIAQEKVDKEVKEEERREWVKLRKTVTGHRKEHGWNKLYVQMRRVVKKRRIRYEKDAEEVYEEVYLSDGNEEGTVDEEVHEEDVFYGAR